VDLVADEVGADVTGEGEYGSQVDLDDGLEVLCRELVGWMTALDPRTVKKDVNPLVGERGEVCEEARDQGAYFRVGGKICVDDDARTPHGGDLCLRRDVFGVSLLPISIFIVEGGIGGNLST